jgi:hypothetical protein
MSFGTSILSLASTAVSALDASPAIPTVSSLLGGALSSNRDSAMGDLGSISTAVNLLSQLANGSGSAGGSGSSGSATSQLTLPPISAAPQAKAPPAVPTDDNGTSNVVFSDPDASSDLIH